MCVRATDADESCTAVPAVHTDIKMMEGNGVLTLAAVTLNSPLGINKVLSFFNSMFIFIGTSVYHGLTPHTTALIAQS